MSTSDYSVQMRDIQKLHTDNVTRLLDYYKLFFLKKNTILEFTLKRLAKKNS